LCAQDTKDDINQANNHKPTTTMKSRRNIRIPLLCAVLGINLLFGAAHSAYAQAKVPLPVDATGEIDGAEYAIKVPANWNGTLLVYAHGYGEVETPPSVGPAAEALLAEGYAMAASTMRNSGWTVEEGLVDTKRLTEHFRANIGRPSRTILWGVSMGSVIVLKSAEIYPRLYDGFIPLCSLGAGTSRNADLTIAVALAYDVAFGWPGEWGRVGDVRDNVDYFEDVLPVLFGQLPEDEVTFGKWEFVRMVTGAPENEFSIFDTMYFPTAGLADFETRAGGSVGQNRDHFYKLTPENIAYLSSLGVDGSALVSQMNARRNIRSSVRGKLYTSRFADYSGEITKPVLTLHTDADPTVLVANERLYKETVKQAGKLKNLVQVYSASKFHCDFTDEQLMTCVHKMDEWLDSGSKPKVTAFPAELGFLPDFEPPAWPVYRPDDNHCD
jgi:pimeloyl-ACP methyl ester carboxylesterase